MERFSALGFVIYLDVVDKIIRAHRVVIVIDSVHRLASHAWDLVVVDEFAEVRRVLPSIPKNSAAGGKWAVWIKFRAALSYAKNLLFLSAHSDGPEYRFLQQLDIKATWQMNQIPLLSHLIYRIILADSDEHALADICERVEKKQPIVIACAENHACLRTAGNQLFI